MPDDVVSEERQKIVEDIQRMAELTRIEQEGSQPQQEPPVEEPPPEEQPAEEEPEQIDDVDTILASLDGNDEPDSELESDAELEEVKIGRPKTGMSFGQDSHPRGRDPLGSRENHDALSIRKKRNDKRKSPLALEMQRWLEVKNSKRVILETKEVTGSLLDESNILDLEN
jgi:hypothetical protein